MKILLVNDYLDKIAGTEIYMYSLKEELEKTGHVVKVFGSGKTKDDYYKSMIDKSVKKYLLRFFNPYSLHEFRRVVKEFQPDIIHLQNIFNELSPSILIATGSIPVIMTVHDSLLVNAVSNLSERTGKACKKRTCGGCMNCVGLKGAIYENIKRPIHRLLLKKIKLYITPSDYMNEFITEAGFKPVKTIHNGIKPLKYTPIKNFNRLLYVGRLTKQKGVDYLIKAMPHVIKEIPDVLLTIVGEGEEKESLSRLVLKLNLLNNVHFAGRVSPDKINNYYEDTTLVVVPSIYPDNFPTVILEAYSAGRPVIGTKIGGLREIIDINNTGKLVNSNNSQEIEQAIIKLIRNTKLLMQMSETCHVKSEYLDIRSYALNIYRTYNNLVK